MPLRERTIDLDEAVQQLERERDEVAAQLADLDPENPAATRLQRQGQRLDERLAGARWARDEAYDDADVPVWDEDTDAITLGGLTGAEYGAVEDELQTAGGGDRPAAGGAARVYLVAHGTVDAPYHAPDHSDAERLAAAGQLPYQFLKFAEHHVNDLTAVGGAEGNRSFSALVAEKRTSGDEPA